LLRRTDGRTYERDEREVNFPKLFPAGRERRRTHTKFQFFLLLSKRRERERERENIYPHALLLLLLLLFAIFFVVARDRTMIYDPKAPC